MDSKFINAVSEKDIVTIRFSISNEMLLDPRGESMKEMVSYALQHIPNLFEIDQPSGIVIPNIDKWDKDLLLQIKDELDNNFSQEKLFIYEKIAKHVLKEKIEKLNAAEKITGSSSEANNIKKNIAHFADEANRVIKEDPLNTAITIAGVATFCISLMAEKTFWVCLGATSGLALTALGTFRLYNNTIKPKKK